MNTYIRYPNISIPTYATYASLPALALDGAVAVVLDVDALYVFDLGTLTWVSAAGSMAVTSIGAIDSTTASVDGAAIVSNALIMQSASATRPGLVNNTTQSFSGNKTFTGTIAASNLSGTNTGDVTLGTANGLSLVGQALSLAQASGSVTGALLNTDWTTFNNKVSSVIAGTGGISIGGTATDPTVSVSNGSLSEATSSVLTITGTNTLLGNTSIQVKLATGAQSGYLSSADWTTFNGKQAAGSYITALTGDVTASGPGSAVATISNLALSKLAALTINRALVSDASGVISAATTTATEIGYVNGVTSAIQTQLDAKQLRSTLTAKGSLYVATASNTVAEQAIGTDGFVLTADSAQTNGLKWAAAAAGTDGSGSYINGSIAASVAANALTVSLKDASGSNPSAGSPVKISFRNATATTGTYSLVSLAASLSVVVQSGSTLGMRSGNTNYVYVYAINNAGTIELAVSSVTWDEGSLVSTTAMSGSSNSNRVLYSTTARSNVACRLIGRIKISEATAGTWATSPTEISNIPCRVQTISCFYSRSSTTVGTSATTLLVTSRNHDTHNFYDTSTGIATIPERGLYFFGGKLKSASAVSSSSVDQTVDLIALHSGSFGSVTIGSYSYQVSSTSVSPIVMGAPVLIPCEAGDTLRLQASRGANIGSFNASSNEETYITIAKLGEII